MRVVKERIDPLVELIYHYKAGPVRVEPKALHMAASLSLFWITTVRIRCLYWET